MNRFLPYLHFLKSNSYKYIKTRPFSTRFENAGTMACQLKSRSVIRFKGPDTVKFLQGLITNDVRKLSEHLVDGNSFPVGTPNMPVIVAPPIYAALLTPQGRFLYDLFLYRPPRTDEKLDRTGSGPGPDAGDFELFADVDSSVLDEIVETLKK